MKVIDTGIDYADYHPAATGKYAPCIENINIGAFVPMVIESPLSIKKRVARDTRTLYTVIGFDKAYPMIASQTGRYLPDTPLCTVVYPNRHDSIDNTIEFLLQRIFFEDLLNGAGGLKRSFYFKYAVSLSGKARHRNTGTQQ